MFLQKIRKNKMKIITLAILIFLMVSFFVFKINKTQRVKGNVEILKANEYDEVFEEDKIVEETDDNVTFDAYFMLNPGNNINKNLRGTCKKVGSEDTLYIDIGVSSGQLTNAEIVVNEETDEYSEDEDYGNIFLQGAIYQDDVIKKDIVSNNIKKIELKDISNKTKRISTKVHSGDYTYQSQKMSAITDMDGYSKNNKITLKGKYISPSGEQKDICKDVIFKVDWYGDIQTEIPEYAYEKINNINQIKNITTAIDEKKEEFTVDFDFYVQETKNELMIQELNVYLTIPEINGFKPTYTEVVAPNTDSYYENESNILSIYRTEENYIITDGIFGVNRVNKFNVKLIYPLEAYTKNSKESLELNIPIEASYGGYNNQDDMYFENPKYSETATDTIILTYQNTNQNSETEFGITVGNQKEDEETVISKKNALRAYNNLPSESKDVYLVTWYALTGGEPNNKLTIKENGNTDKQVTDNFIKSNNQKDSIEKISKNIGIYCSNLSDVIDDDGELKVYDDETNELLISFNKENCRKYSEKNPYYYERPIEHIRIETTEVKANSNIYIHNIKQLDDYGILNKYSKEDFEDINYIESTVSGFINGQFKSTSINKAKYKNEEIQDELTGGAALKIKITEKGSTDAVKNTVFKLTGKNYEEGKSLKTNESGELKFDGLEIDEEYVLEQIPLEGYTSIKPVKFTITSEDNIEIYEDDEEYKHEDAIKSSSVSKEADVSVAILQIESEKLSKCNIKITKISSENDQPLEGVKYKLYYGNNLIGEYQTQQDGSILISDLYKYNENTEDNSCMYTLKETDTLPGYAKISDIKFTLETSNSNILMNVIEGKIENQEYSDNILKIVITGNRGFKLINRDKNTNINLAGSKFAIYRVGKEEDEIALDSNYQIIGTKEEINGQTYYTLTTNGNGEIEADLREGLYKAIQISTVNERYDLTNNVYYFGVGINEWIDVSRTAIDNNLMSIEYLDDGYIGYGEFYDSFIELNTSDNKNAIIENNGEADALIVKYNENGDVSWIYSIGEEGNERVDNVIGTKDGGVLAYIISTSERLTINDIEYTNSEYEGDYNFYEYGILVKLNNAGNVEWSKQIGEKNNLLSGSIIETNDDGYINYGNFSVHDIKVESTVVENKSDEYIPEFPGALPDGEGEGEYSDYEVYGDSSKTYYSDFIMIKYNKSGDIEWINSISGKRNDDINNISVLENGEILLYGSTNSGNSVQTSTIENSIKHNELSITSSNANNLTSGMILKCDSQGNFIKSNILQTQTANTNDYVKIVKVINTEDEGFLVSGNLQGTINIDSKSLVNNSGYDNGILIKYSNDFKVQWMKLLKSEGINEITDIEEISNGEYVFIGNYSCEKVMIDDKTFNNTSYIETEDTEGVGNGGKIKIYTSNSVIGKIDPNGTILSAMQIDGKEDDKVLSVNKLDNGNYVVLGESNSENIKIGNQYVLDNVLDVEYMEDSEEAYYNNNTFIITISSSDKIKTGRFIQGFNIEFNDITNELNYREDLDVIRTKLLEPSDTIVLNEFKKPTISFEIDNTKGKVDGYIGGIFEVVEYDTNSKREIKVIPKDDYEVSYININGEIQKFNVEEDNSVIIPKFTHVKDDILIKIGFASINEKVTINVQDETGNPIENVSFIIENIAENDDEVENDDWYIDEDEIFEPIQVITNNEGKAYISLTDGEYQINSISIPLGYETSYKTTFIVNTGDENNVDIVLHKLDRVTVHHYLKSENGNYTTQAVAQDDVYTGKTGEEYSAPPRTDLENYELIKGSDDNYIIPGKNADYKSDSATGTFSGNKEVIYYYKERQPILVVHHYKSGTNEKIHYADETEVPDIIEYGKIGDSYNTSAIPNYNVNNLSQTLPEGYAVKDIEGNENGKYIGNETIVNYFYEIQKFTISTKVNKHLEKTMDGSEVLVTGGHITGEEKRVYEEVEFGGDSIYDIEVRPDPGYRITAVKINGSDQEISPDDDGNFTLGYLENVRENKEIEAFFDRYTGSVIVSYYDEETDDTIIEDQEITGYIGFNYNIETDNELVPKYYEFVRAEGSLTGTFQETPQTVKLYYKLRDYQYTIEYYYDDDIDGERTEKGMKKYHSIISEEDLAEKIEENTKPGFRFDYHVNLPLEVSDDLNNNTIRIYYTSKDVDDENKSRYTVEYYYDGNKEYEEVNTARIGEIIDTYVPRCPEGYVLVATEGLGLVIDKDPTKNIIRIYYEHRDDYDEETAANYVIEYYYNKVMDPSKRQVILSEVGAKITRAMLSNNINVNNKEGYRVSSITNLPLIVSKNEEDNIIQIYYTKVEEGEGGEDDDKRQDAFYSIEYYYDENTNFEFGETFSAKVGDIISRDMIIGSIIEHQKENYKLDSIVNIPLNVQEDESKNIIKVYYVKLESGEEPEDPIKSGRYKINYYYDNNIDITRTEIVEAKIGKTIYREDLIKRILNNQDEGYRLATTEEIKDSDEGVVGTPLIIDEDENKNIIKVYYFKDSYEYKIEYYYDNEKIPQKTDSLDAKKGEIITKELISSKIEENTKEGYRLSSVVGVPLEIKEDESKNVIKVYYVTKDEEIDPDNSTRYTIEYYYDGNKNGNKTEIIETKIGETITREDINGKIEANKGDSYILSSVVGVPLEIQQEESQNIIKVYYVTKDEEIDPDNSTRYTIEYYYDGNKNGNKTEIIETKIGETITREDINGKIEANKGDSYRLSSVIGLPLEIQQDESQNIIKVYYVKIDGEHPDPQNNTRYTIEYYYDNSKDAGKTETVEAKIGDTVTREDINGKIEANKGDSYRLSSVLGLPLEVQEDASKNIIKVYYVKIDGEHPDPQNNTRYTIEYYYDNNKDAGKTETVEAKTGDTVTREMLSEKITQNQTEGYRLSSVVGLPLEVQEDASKNIIKVYYVKIDGEHPDPQNNTRYTIEYYYDNSKNAGKTETIEAKTGETITREMLSEKITQNQTEGYRLSSVIGLPLEIQQDESKNVIKVYYVKIDRENPDPENNTRYTIEYYYDNNKDAGKTETVEAKTGDTVTREDINGKIEANKGDSYRLSSLVGLPLEVQEDESRNVIKVYYVTKDEDIDPDNSTRYTIEYYYDGNKNGNKTETIEAKSGTTITREDINEKIEANKGDSYRLSSVLGLPLEVQEDESRNIIKVYYVTKRDGEPETDTRYTIEYYYDNSKDVGKTETIEAKSGTTITREDINEKIEANKGDSYRLSSVLGLPLEVQEDESRNIIKVYYVTKRDGEPETDTRYTIEYYYDNSKDVGKTETIEAKTGDTVTREDINGKIEANKGDSYRLSSVIGLPLEAQQDESKNIIKVYYVKIDEENPDPQNNTRYTIEYYYDNNKDVRKTETIEAKTGTTITREMLSEKITQNQTEGYRLSSVIGLPLEVQEDESKNIIKVYYVKIDEEHPNPQNNTRYTIEYYYDNNKDAGKTETIEAKSGETVTREMLSEKITQNQTEGYRLSSVIGLPLEIQQEESKNVIKVYYVTKRDGEPETDTRYTIEYYYDNNKDAGKTETVEAKTGDTITREDINGKIEANKGDSYRLSSVVGLPLEVQQDESKNIIKVYYVKIDGEHPDPQNNTRYTIEYYYDNNKDAGKTETVEAKTGDTVTREDINGKIEANKGDNYRLSSVIGLPLEVQQDESRNVIKVYYVTKRDGEPETDTRYTIEYYYDNNKDTEKTETIEAKSGETVTREMLSEKITQNQTEGYRLSSVIGLPLEIQQEESKNVIKVYYVTKRDGEPETDTRYTIEYYYDNNKDAGKTETVEAKTGETITREDINTNIEANKGDSYRLSSVVGVPLEVQQEESKNIIKVYYVKIDGENPDPQNNTRYTIEYYYDNSKDAGKTETVEAKTGDTITREDINGKIEANKGDSYRLSSVIGLPLEVQQEESKNIIKVYYVKIDGEHPDPQNNTRYTIEYYYDNNKDVGKTEIIEAKTGTTITREMLSEKITQNQTEGYRLSSVLGLPLEIQQDESKNVIKVYYVTKRDGEPETDTRYTIEYYYDNNKDAGKTETVEAKTGETITREMLSEKITQNQTEGYKLSSVIGVPLTIKENQEENKIEIYYIKIGEEEIPIDPEKTSRYTIEYYYDGIKNERKTETIEAEIGSLIERETIETRIQNNKLEGYRLATEYEADNTVNGVNGLPLTINKDANLNIIKVYYVENVYQYTIKYFYDNDLEEDLTETIKAEKDEIIRISDIQDKINKNKKYGYRLANNEEVPNSENGVIGLPLKIEEDSYDNVVEIYYVTDENQTKELSYTVEYYKDNERESISTIKEEVQVLQSDILKVNKTEINTQNKYKGYELEQITTVLNEEENVVEQIPNEVENGTIIRIYYVKGEYNYNIEYYYNGVLNREKTDTLKALYQTEITKDMIISNIEENLIDGYKYYDTLNIPLVITENEEENVIKVCYIKDVEIGYTIEYYYNGIKDILKTEVNEAQINDEITIDDLSEKIDNNKKDGYKLLTVINVPLIVNEDSSNNIIKICYVKDVENGYIVEYYYNGQIDDSKTEINEASVDDIITEDMIMPNIVRNTITGYKYKNSQNLPLTVKENINNNRIKVNYELLDFYYSIQFYLDGKLDQNRTITRLAKYGDIIEEYTAEEIRGYELKEIIGTPLKITENQDTNVIKVYYTRKEYAYKIQYYFDGELDNNLTVEGTELYGETIKDYPNNIKPDYRLDRRDNYPLVITDNVEQNIMKIYYVLNYSNIVIRYIDATTGNDLEPSITLEDIVGRPFDLSGYEKEYDGYRLLEKPRVTTGTYTEQTQVFAYYYAKNAKVVVKYLEQDETPDNSDNLVLTYEETDDEGNITNKEYGYEIDGYIGKDYKTERKEIKDYIFVKSTDNTYGRMLSEETEVIYYYAKKSSIKVQHIDEKTDKILKEEVIEGKVGDSIETHAQNFDYYVLSRGPENPTVQMKKDEVVIVKYYYKEYSEGVLEKHIDYVSKNILHSEYHEGEPGDSYKIEPRDFDNYDLKEDMLPDNSEGTMKNEIIEVDYYYVKKAKVVVEYVDKIENTIIETEEITGHEGDKYTTKAKEYEDYVLVEEPENKEETMTSDTIYVRYYYVHKSKGVIVKYIDEKTDNIIEEIKIEGKEGDYYEVELKKYDGYDLIEEKLPDNLKGYMQEDLIEIEIYYIRKAKVIVQYIDKLTDTIIETEEITGHEGDTYTTKAKEYEDYDLVEEPENKEGMMTNEEIIVKYYYLHKAQVIEKHIDVKTGDLLEPETVHTGHEGDKYITKAKTFENYDLVEEHYPDNSEGTMTVKDIIVKYYYIRKAKVIVRYIEYDTKEEIAENTIIEGHEEQKYKSEAKEIEGYELLKDMLPANAEGYMSAEPIEVTYYYKEIDDDRKSEDEDKKEDNNNEKNDDDNDTNNNNTDNNSNDNDKNNNSYEVNNNQNNPNNSNIPNNKDTKNISNNVNKSQENKEIKENNKTEETEKEQNEKQDTVPYTGDNVPKVTIFTMIFTIVLNIIQISISKIKNRKRIIK